MGELPETVDAGTIAGDAGDVGAFLMVFPGEGLALRLVDLFEGVEVTFGRSRTATVPLEDERVSRLNTRVVLRGRQVIVEDLGSRNGTQVNGARIAGPTALAAGGTIAVGPMLALLRRGRPPVGPAGVAPADGAVIVDAGMRRLYETVDKVAATPMTVLIYGETGAGKELVADALHQRSGRSGPIVRLNCASLPETLLESELFGHEKGSFTGADRRKVGYFEAAVGGTLFLDEIGEIAPALQAKLLRALERRAVVRVGGTAEIPVDVRLVAATHRDLEAEIRAGRFREDLFFRISSFMLTVPPLRDRRDDILPLAEHFVAGFAAELDQRPPVLSDQARRRLLGHSWPGNVRELRNAIERAVVMQSGGVIEPEHLPERLGGSATAAPPGAGKPATVDVREQLADVERAAIVAALDASEGNQTRAAKQLGLSRRALIYKLEKYGLKAPPDRKGS